MRERRDLRGDFNLVGMSGKKRRDFGRKEEVGREDCRERNRD